MNSAHFHLLLNHFPVIGTFLSALLLLFAFLRKSEEAKRLALSTLFFVALTAVPAYLTGEPAEGVVEHLPGVAESFIEAHESAALFALIALLVSGLVALVGLFLFRAPKSLPQWFILFALALTALSAAAMGRTANLGGQIRHTEIRAGGAPNAGETRQSSEQKPQQNDDDDDTPRR